MGDGEIKIEVVGRNWCNTFAPYIHFAVMFSKHFCHICWKTSKQYAVLEFLSSEIAAEFHCGS